MLLPRMWYLCPQSLLADGSSMATCKKWIQGPHIHSPLSGHVSLCLNHRCPNLLSRSSCSPNESLAAGPLYKTDKQKGSLAEVREERRVPILLGLPVPSVAPPGTCRDIQSAQPYLCPFSNRFSFSSVAPPSPILRQGFHAPALPISQCHTLSAVTDLGKTRDLSWSRVQRWNSSQEHQTRSLLSVLGLLGWLSGRQNLWASTGESLPDIAKSEDSRPKS